MVDVTVEEHGESLFLFRVATPEAQEWFDENVQTEPHSWWGNLLAVDPRHASNLAQGLRDAGFEVE